MKTFAMCRYLCLHVHVCVSICVSTCACLQVHVYMCVSICLHEKCGVPQGWGSLKVTGFPWSVEGSQSHSVSGTGVSKPHAELKQSWCVSRENHPRGISAGWRVHADPSRIVGPYTDELCVNMADVEVLRTVVNSWSSYLQQWGNSRLNAIMIFNKDNYRMEKVHFRLLILLTSYFSHISSGEFFFYSCCPFITT